MIRRLIFQHVESNDGRMSKKPYRVSIHRLRMKQQGVNSYFEYNRRQKPPASPPQVDFEVELQLPVSDRLAERGASINGSNVRMKRFDGAVPGVITETGAIIFAGSDL